MKKVTERQDIRSGLYPGNLQSSEPYFFDEMLYNNTIELHNRALNYYSGLVSSYATLKLGEINIDILRRIASGDLAEIESKVYSKIQENIYNLKKLNIEDEIMLNNLSTGMDAPLLAFKESVRINTEHLQRVQTSQPGTPLDISSYTLFNGSLIFGDLEKQHIKEKFCTTYIDTEQKQKFVGIAENILNEINELKFILLKNGLKTVIGYHGAFQLEESGEQQIINFNKSIIQQIKN